VPLIEPLLELVGLKPGKLEGAARKLVVNAGIAQLV
jgi:hypothetical protein